MKLCTQHQLVSKKSSVLKYSKLLKDSSFLHLLLSSQHCTVPVVLRFTTYLLLKTATGPLHVCLARLLDVALLIFRHINLWFANLLFFYDYLAINDVAQIWGKFACYYEDFSIAFAMSEPQSAPNAFLQTPLGVIRCQESENSWTEAIKLSPHATSIRIHKNKSNPIDRQEIQMNKTTTSKMSVKNQNMHLATSVVAPPSLLTQVGMAGTAAVITVRAILHIMTIFIVRK